MQANFKFVVLAEDQTRNANFFWQFLVQDFS